jgi:hypothetical protein
MSEKLKSMIRESGMFVDSETMEIGEAVARECMKIISDQTTQEENKDYRDGFSQGRKMHGWRLENFLR